MFISNKEEKKTKTRIIYKRIEARDFGGQIMAGCLYGLRLLEARVLNV